MFSTKGSSILYVFIALLFSSLLVSCSTPPPKESSPILLVPTPSSPPKIITIPPTEKPAPIQTATIIPTQSISEVELDFPLSKPGKYFSGKHSVEYAHPWMENSKLSLRIFYPAIKPADFTGTIAWDIKPDMSSAPYPVLLCSTTIANEFATHLVSHGFVVVSVEGQNSYDTLGSKLIDYPQEILAALDDVTDNPPAELIGIMETDNVGVFGYSFDGYNALALSGARFDPSYYQKSCSKVESIIPESPTIWTGWIDYMCPGSTDFLTIVGDAGKRLTISEDGLWQPMIDPRIKAAMPMAPEGALLFGERGLNAVNIPILIIGATADEYCPYSVEAVPIYEHIGSQDKSLISFIDQNHMMIFDIIPKAKIEHFLVAFFKYQLMSSQEDAYYFSEEFVNKQPGLFWGVYGK
jgi:predicted dienelactone hydrolase